jgi:hypothetical protein
MNAKLRLRTLTVLSGIGYIAVAFQWMAVTVAGLPGLFDSRLGRIIFPQQTVQPELVISPDSTQGAAVGHDFVTTFLLTGLALVVIALVTYVVVIRYTAAINKTSSKVVHAIAKKAAPVIAHKPLKKISPPKLTILNRRLLFWTKVIFAVVPLAILPIVLHDGERGVVEQLAIFLQALLALVAVVSFVAQAVFTKRWHARTADVS